MNVTFGTQNFQSHTVKHDIKFQHTKESSVLSVLNVRKYLQNVKVSNVTGEYIQKMAYYSATVVAGKLFSRKDKDMLVRYGVMIILSVTNAANSSLILKVYINTRPKTIIRPTNVMSVRN